MEDTTFPAIMTDFERTFLSEASLRKLKDKEVLIRVESAAINPNDQLFTLGFYGENYPDPPLGVGFEGSGIIIDIGNNVDPNFEGKRIAFFQQPSMPEYAGTWRKYLIMKAEGLVTYPEELDFDSISTISINPPTVCGFIDIATKKEAKAIIHDVGSSALGKMLTRLCKKYEIALINIVRRQEQIDILNDYGAEVVLNSSDENFNEDLKNAINEHQPTVFFDAIGGKFWGEVLSLMPNESTMYVYGNLSGEPIFYDAGNIIFKWHKISSFLIWNWLSKLSEEEKSKWFGEIADDILNGGEIFGTKIAKTYPLSKFKEAMKFAKEHASEGKVILKPQI